MQQLHRQVHYFVPRQGTRAGRAGRTSHRTQRPKRIFVAIAAAVIAIPATAVALLLIDASMLRSPIARYLSARLDRAVAIHGDLRVDVFGSPRVEINEIVVGNAQWGSRPTMLRVERALIGIRLLPLLEGRIVLPEVELTQPDVLLERNADGAPNWRFGKQPLRASNARWGAPEVRSLSIKDARLQFRDSVAGSDVVLHIDSDRAGADDSMVGFVGRGRLRDRDFELEGRAASLLELTAHGKPYRLNITARAGETEATFDGTVVPLKLATIDGRLELSGRDLSKLYPIVPVPLPWTASYRLSGHLLRDGQKYSLRGFTGRVGGSDVQGSASLDLGRKRPLFVADVTSRRLDYKDLAGFLGAPPPQKGQPRPPDQQRAVEQRQETDRVLPTKPYDLRRLRAIDARVRLKAKSILSRGLPLDDMAADLRLDDGKLVLAPLDFGVAGGRVTSDISLDARKDVIGTELNATANNLEAKALLPELKRSAGSAGKVGGRAVLSVTGNSVAEMAGSANGEVALIMSQGRASTISLVLINLDLANAAKYLLYGDPNAPVYCGVITAEVRDGRMTPDDFVVDSSEEKITGEGRVDLQNEQYDLRLVADSKRASLVALRGPIRIGGTFKHPEVRPEVGPVAARAGAAIALGVLATPLAALLPLVDPGNAKGADCRGLIQHARKEVPATPIPERQAPERHAAGDKRD